MNIYFGWLGVIAFFASAASAAVHQKQAERPNAAAAPCAADSNYQRLAFWVGDWDVYDSTGAHYAVQRVHPVVDACAFTAEWTGRVGDKGLAMFAFDGKAREWRQIYVSNQIPYPSGVTLRKSDPTYSGPGVRFIQLLDPPLENLARTRVTIMPLSEHRAMQEFEDSRDGGKTWHVEFKGEHRLQP
jgi:hypothetical protein